MNLAVFSCFLLFFVRGVPNVLGVLMRGLVSMSVENFFEVTPELFCVCFWPCF